ncbi:type IV secretion system protein [Fusobacterium nucleatum]|uniref:type IV secretion system protein n=1 Tax=Fusobacterium nucleatum TaxID=851 RepID=UPI003098DBF6
MGSGRFSYKPTKSLYLNEGIASPENPYYDRMLSLAKNCRNWQIAFLVMSCFTFFSLIAYVRLANKTKLVPFIVEIDKERKPTFVGRMDQINYIADDSVVFSILNEFVINVRSISLDKVFTYKKIKMEYSFLGKDMKNKMNGDINALNLEKKFKDKQTIDVQVTSMLKNSDNIYQINWTEKYYTDGNYTSLKKWTGVFSITQDKNLSEEDILINPLGIIIQDYHITADLSK